MKILMFSVFLMPESVIDIAHKTSSNVAVAHRLQTTAEDTALQPLV